jgi:hypothetical protein
MWSSMFPLPDRVLVNFAHSGFVNDRRWDDEGKPPCFLYVIFVPEERTEQGGQCDGQQNRSYLAVNRPIFIH